MQELQDYLHVAHVFTTPSLPGKIKTELAMPAGRSGSQRATAYTNVSPGLLPTSLLLPIFIDGHDIGGIDMGRDWGLHSWWSTVYHNTTQA